MNSFHRSTLFRTKPFGLDSVQGYLELAQWYNDDHVKFSCDPSDASNHKSMYFKLCQLEREGHVTLLWSPREDHDSLIKLEQVSLTADGFRLLEELKRKSKFGKIKSGILKMLWVGVCAVVTSVITTLITLQLKG